MFRALVIAASFTAVSSDSTADNLPHARRFHLSKGHSVPHREARTSLVGLKIASAPKSNQNVISHQLAKKAVQSEVVTDSSVASHLQNELAELKQRRAHIKQLEEALKTDAGLLHESVTLERMSKSSRSHELAAQQVKEATQVVKATEQMLHESKANAVEMSSEMLHEADAIKSAADDLAAEASQQLSVFKTSAHHESSMTTTTTTTTTTLQKVGAASKVLVTSKAKADADEDLDDIEDEN